MVFLDRRAVLGRFSTGSVVQSTIQCSRAQFGGPEARRHRLVFRGPIVTGRSGRPGPRLDTLRCAAAH
jgi:hypothetical protein